VDVGTYSSRLGAKRKCLDNLPNIVDLGETVLSENEADKIPYKNEEYINYRYVN
jgi:hypothetical protein